MIAESLHHTIQLIETVNKVAPPEDKKIDRELSYLVEHMEYVENLLREYNCNSF